jgi:hypothetical protein
MHVADGHWYVEYMATSLKAYMFRELRDYRAAFWMESSYGDLHNRRHQLF